MRQKLAFPALLILLGAAASVYFSYRLTVSCFAYFPLASQAEAHIARWEIKEIKDRFALKAIYSFEAQEKNWSGATLLAKPWHLNEAAAIAALKDKAKQKWTVWFNPAKPAQSSLERIFPIGLLCRTLLCYAVLAYFIFTFTKIVNNFVD